MPRPASLHLVALLTACSAAPSLTVRATDDLGPLETSPHIQARDGGYSFAMRDRSVWLYGDTVLSAPALDGTQWRHNTASWTTDLDAADGLHGFEQDTDTLGAPTHLFAETDDEAAYNTAHAGDPCDASPCGAREILWPGPAVYDAERDRALIFWVKIHGEPGPWNFHGLGSGVALWQGPGALAARPQPAAFAHDTSLLFGPDEGGYASAAALDDGWLYVFGCDGPDKACRLARVEPARATERPAWAFWDGSAFQDDASAAVGLFSGMDMTSVHRSERAGGWIAVYSPPLDDRIAYRTAPELTGPWSDEATLLHTLQPEDDSYAYSGLAHAELQEEDGGVEYVSYYRALGAWHGELRLVRVELD
jgi:hypothetical protein